MEQTGLAERFEENRAHLRAVAHRMLGSLVEADDAVQEAWLRLSRSGADGVDNLGGWLTTVVARVCLDMLRSRTSRREQSLGSCDPGTVDGPERDVLLADAVGPALLVVLDTLAPVERLAFVLHDLFAVPFDEIAPIVGRTPAAARQLASRARRRVQGVSASGDVGRQREIVDAFLAASRAGDFAALLALLDPDVVLRADGAVVRAGASAEVRGAAAVAEQFSGRARAAQPALVDGVAAAVWAPGGQPRVVFLFTITVEIHVRGLSGPADPAHVDLARGAITEIELVADPERLGDLDLVILDDD